MDQNMTKLKYYRTDVGILVSNPSTYSKILINGVPSEMSFCPNWIIVKNVYDIKSVELKQPDLAINKRYIRKDSAPKTLPEIFYRDEIPDYFDNICELYTYEVDYLPQPNKNIEFEAEFLGELKMDSLGDPTTFKFTMNKIGMGNGECIDYNSLFSGYPWSDNSIHVDEVIKSVVPNFAWHLYPCSLTSSASYRIVRHHVKNYIDTRFARITSDYDFCFTVSKLIPIKPWISKNEQLNQKGKSYRPPRITERKITHKEEPIFSMTQDKDKYRGYPIIDGFQGNSLKDLEDNILRYLNELMELINKPLSLCPKCEGQGYAEGYISLKDSGK